MSDMTTPTDEFYKHYDKFQNDPTNLEAIVRAAYAVGDSPQIGHLMRIGDEGRRAYMQELLKRKEGTI